MVQASLDRNWLQAKYEAVYFVLYGLEGSFQPACCRVTLEYFTHRRIQVLFLAFPLNVNWELAFRCDPLFIVNFCSCTYHDMSRLCCTTLDISDIKFVINFDFPSCSEDYVHRIGRTARSNRTGTSYTFFTTGNAKQAKDLISILKEANQHVNPKLMALAEQAKGMFGRGKKMVEFPMLKLCQAELRNTERLHVWGFLVDKHLSAVGICEKIARGR